MAKQDLDQVVPFSVNTLSSAHEIFSSSISGSPFLLLIHPYLPHLVIYIQLLLDSKPRMRLLFNSSPPGAAIRGGQLLRIILGGLVYILLSSTSSWAYPAYLLDPDEGCVKKLEVGFELMAKPAVADTKRGPTPIKVGR